MGLMGVRLRLEGSLSLEFWDQGLGVGIHPGFGWVVQSVLRFQGLAFSLVPQNPMVQGQA